MKLRFHPAVLPLLLFLMITGGVSLYAMLLFSLIFHEFGHIAAARAAGMKIRSCTIMPYGGELQISGRHTASRRQRLQAALGGPAATAVLLIAGYCIHFPGNGQFIFIQQMLLAVNLLPVLPLDGGQVLSILLEGRSNKHLSRANFTLYSIAATAALCVYLALYLPQSLLFMALAAFLCAQNVMSYRFRKYEEMLERLTKREVRLRSG